MQTVSYCGGKINKHFSGSQLYFCHSIPLQRCYDTRAASEAVLSSMRGGAGASGMNERRGLFPRQTATDYLPSFDQPLIKSLT